MIKVRNICFADVIAQVDSLRQHLADNDVRIHPASILSELVDSTCKVNQAFETGNIPSSLDVHQAVADLANLSLLARAVLEARGTPFEYKLRTKLPDLARGDPRQLNSGKHTQSRTEVFELLCGSVTNRFASDVAFEEPDVLCRFRGSKWGIACKCISGSPATVVQRIFEGRAQVQLSSADLGLVVVQVTNLFPHEAMYSMNSDDGEIRSLASIERLSDLFDDLMQRTTGPFERELHKRIRQKTSNHYPKARALLFVAHTVPYFKRRRTMMAGSLVYPFRTYDDPARKFIQHFNEELQEL